MKLVKRITAACPHLLPALDTFETQGMISPDDLSALRTALAEFR